MALRSLREAVAAGTLSSARDLNEFAAALAAVIADMHSSGIVLGALDADSVALDSPRSVRVRPAAPSPAGWMAPERRGGMDTGVVGDSYLWGACVGFAATGVDTPAGSSPVPPSLDPLASLVSRALSPAPAMRPGLAEIGAVLGASGAASAAAPPTGRTPSPDAGGRRATFLWAAVGAVIAAAVAVGAVVFLIGRGSSQPPTADPVPLPIESTMTADPAPSPTAVVESPDPAPAPDVTIDPRPQPPPGPGVVAPPGTSFFEAQSGPVRCAYFPEGTAGQVIACIDDQSDTLVRLNAGMIRVTQVTQDQSVQVPRTGPLLGPADGPRLLGTRPSGKPLFECWGVPGGIACREGAQGDWFVMTAGELETS